MKKTQLLLLILTTLLMQSAVVQAAPLQITVSIVPQKYFVDKIGGELVETNIMVRPGSSPATYEPQPKQMAQLSKANIYFAIGVPFEKAWLPRFKSAGDNMKVIDLSKSVRRMPMQKHFHHEEDPQEQKKHDDHADHTDHFMFDPHIWLSPPLVRIICMDIRDTLIKLDPENESVYSKNYLNFARKIDELDSKLLQLFSSTQKDLNFMVYHPSWGYFAKSYGLKQIPIELEGKEPSPKKLAELIDFAKKESVSAIFIQPQFSRKSAQAIASSIGAKVLTADPLAEDWAANLEKAARSFLQE